MDFLLNRYPRRQQPRAEGKVAAEVGKVVRNGSSAVAPEAFACLASLGAPGADELSVLVRVAVHFIPEGEGEGA